MNGSAEGATKTPVAKAKPRVSTALPPTIAPRTNRSAALRAAKMALDAAGTDKTPAKKGVKKPAATPRAIRI